MAAAPAVVTVAAMAGEVAADAVAKARAATAVAMVAVAVVQTAVANFSRHAAKAPVHHKAKAVDAHRATTTLSTNPQQALRTKVAHRVLATRNPTRCVPTSI